jgi:hypothetical protein
LACSCAASCGEIAGTTAFAAATCSMIEAMCSSCAQLIKSTAPTWR